ncbi:hypothetical protein [Rufibacter tibetensis]|uniref:Uncharacterized protein n=1 Tax=Rufibacter tibetensis TaxID=512763 RepID=A0A0P0CLL7_9BACT|nr:hypothetical protein [Rufibacter tibetensis]ALJ00551.1 hypothetical protein DC20_18215 [Rufibacter tibetensis]
MKKDQLSTLIAVGFFAGTFVIAFTSNDSDTAALRVLAYLAIGCLLSILCIFWDRIISKEEDKSHAHLDTVLHDAKKFSDEYGDVYLMADKLKNKRKVRGEDSISGSPA